MNSIGSVIPVKNDVRAAAPITDIATSLFSFLAAIIMAAPAAGNPNNMNGNLPCMYCPGFIPAVIVASNPLSTLDRVITSPESTAVHPSTAFPPMLLRTEYGIPSVCIPNHIPWSPKYCVPAAISPNAEVVVNVPPTDVYHSGV